MDKSSLAVSEAIKRYQVPIEKMTLNNNGIKSSEFCLMVDCMTKHFEKLQVLKVTNNKIGFLGAQRLSETLRDMKVLNVLDLSFDCIGDLGIDMIC